ncbi:MAG TPA: hypothetical protein VFJ16_31255 [Longimicrobium sp.]|nr:hypothetical protein [Longimicrobium sp.]
MESKAPVAPITPGELRIGSVSAERAADLLGVGSTASVRRFRRDGHLEMDGALYTLKSIHELVEQRVRQAIVPADRLDAFLPLVASEVAA